MPIGSIQFLEVTVLETMPPLPDPGYDAFDADCPTRELLDELSDKWVSLVLVALVNGPQRHSELRRRLSGVSQKMLTQTLRSMERDGVVTRTVTASVPVRVDYELTELGVSLTSVVHAVKLWAEANMDSVAQARKAYDLRV